MWGRDESSISSNEYEDRCSIRAHRFDFSRGANWTTQGVNSATASTGKKDLSRTRAFDFQYFRRVGIDFCVMIFFLTRSGFFRRPFEFNGYKRL